MTTLKEFQAAETGLRTLLENAGMPEPDEIEYRETSIVALWHESKAAIVVDLEEGPEEEHLDPTDEPD